ncbi:MULTISPECIES: DEAD/DEAH box helicase family protein [unclassified Thermosynechococcus]|uniref:DEAD/DEAH box helicase family protein n=1 Tax=unclassified Thermosynechococcus TaxID=2622553 RepID=UPI00287303A4|nr:MULTISPECIES: DEAD/DEAH box helicase family protein [unclassified Thermosynechococcus]WNC33055.1 DEAD/DEAH box helicase family protein [Thermosynechococcus sp. PKX95]WNC35581.1 DEAD/DEAH box helicase family protein [Thermosynechococcus sp. PKX91]WNC38102.1 DEAD/DEAH box helicase family protein [Thermosynechococcus sp. WL11]WNC40623.1 DEAD/DEAH box helicase family protein [Thermosynechococcus sp. WL17]WNC43143.1 DEAD/DEAH box helicase family protein [Thermosynechococcus sp. WL15]
MKPINEDEAELLIEEHLRERGWNLTDFTVTRKRWREHLNGEEADRIFFHEEHLAAILEAKKPGKDLWAALEQAKRYARTYKENTGHNVPLIFASDGQIFLRQNLKANTLPERITRFPTPAEFGEFFRPQAVELHGTLRDYQRMAVSQVLAAVQAGRHRMYLQMATGTGKTITAAGIIAKLWSVGLIRRTLFLVDRDALAVQTVKKFKTHLGDNFNIERATGGKEDKHRDVLVTTIQHMAVRNRYQEYDTSHFSLVILDECHRSYFGEWYGVLDHFAKGGAILLGLTATPADKETVNTDRFFTDPGQYPGPIYRYTIRQAETNPEVPEWERLAQCIHFKFHTNVDLEGVHDMGFDFEPEQLGRAVDVPQRSRLIAEKYFEDILGTRQPVKTMVFAASIAHAKNLRYALIEEYNRRNNLPPNDAAAEKFIVAVHNEMPGARELIEEFQKITPPEERKAIIEQAHKDPNMAPRPIVLVGVGMLDTGIDAPDVEVLLMARPTKSKVLYVQMKGRGTRKCRDTGKEFYKLVDFVDITRLEPVVTNDTPGIVDEPLEQEEESLIQRERGERNGKEPSEKDPRAEQQMVIADVPVHLVFSETISPAVLEELRRQVEAQLKGGMEREGLKHRFVQTLLCWRYFKGAAPPDHSFLATMGFDLSALRDLYGEPEATLEDFIAVAMGEADFETLRRRREFEKWALGKNLNAAQREMVLMVLDFKRANPEITPEQILRSHLLEQAGGLPAIRKLFGGLDKLIALADEALSIETGTPIEEENDGNRT